MICSNLSFYLFLTCFTQANYLAFKVHFSHRHAPKLHVINGGIERLESYSWPKLFSAERSTRNPAISLRLFNSLVGWLIGLSRKHTKDRRDYYQALTIS